jgi:hypothetical protein
MCVVGGQRRLATTFVMTTNNMCIAMDSVAVMKQEDCSVILDERGLTGATSAWGFPCASRRHILVFENAEGAMTFLDKPGHGPLATTHEMELQFW